MGLQGWWFFLWVAMMEIQFELEDDPFYEISRVCLLEMPRQNDESLEPHNHQCFRVIWEIIMGYVLATFVRFATSPWLVLLMEQLRLTSWVWQFIPVIIYHGFYTSQVTVSNFFHQQCFKEKMQKNKAIPRKKMPSCIYPSWSKTSQLLSFVGSQPSHFRISESKKSHR